MRQSTLLLPTLKENPADADVVSHRLMLRAGLIRQLASGLYTWLPLGLRVLRKVERIIREEMNISGAQEVMIPVVQPAELWQQSGRWDDYGPELLRFSDRHQRDFCFGPTHEEVITTLLLLLSKLLLLLKKYERSGFSHSERPVRILSRRSLSDRDSLTLVSDAPASPSLNTNA